MSDYQNSALLDALNSTLSVDEGKIFADSFKSLASQIDRHNCGYECTIHDTSKTYASNSQKADFNFKSDSLNKVSNFSNSFSLTDILIPQNKLKSVEVKIESAKESSDDFNQMYKSNDSKTFGSKEYVKEEKTDWYSSVLKVYESKKVKYVDFEKEGEMEKSKNDKRSGSEERSEESQSGKPDDAGPKQDSGRDRGNDEPKQSVLSSSSGSSAGVLQPDNAESELDDSGSSEGNEGRAGKVGPSSDSAGSKLQDSSRLHTKDSV